MVGDSARWLGAQRSTDGTRERWGDFVPALDNSHRDKDEDSKVIAARQRLAESESAHGPNDVAITYPLSDLANLCLLQSRYEEAELLYRRSLALLEAAYGAEDAEVALAMKDLARLYRKQSRYGEAEELCRRSLAIAETTLEPDNRNLAAILWEVALLRQAQSHCDEAESLYRRSLAIAENALGPDDPNVAAILYDLAGLLETQLRYEDAEPLYRRIIPISEATFGPESIGVANMLAKLSGILRAQSRYDEAEPLVRRILAIADAVYGSESPRLHVFLMSLAQLHLSQSRYTEAEPLYRRSLAILEAAHGPDHPEVAEALSDLAWLYETQSRYSEAEPLYRRCVAILEEAYPADHPEVTSARKDLAAILKAQSSGKEAESPKPRSRVKTTLRLSVDTDPQNPVQSWVVLLNVPVFSGWVAGIVWLAFLREWGDLGIALLVTVLVVLFGAMLCGLALTPGTLMTLPALLLYAKGGAARVASYPLMLLAHLWAVAMMSVWALFWFGFFQARATASSLVPMLLIAFMVATHPWVYASVKESEMSSGADSSLGTSVGVIALQIACAVVLVLSAFAGASPLAAVAALFLIMGGGSLVSLGAGIGAAAVRTRAAGSAD